MWAALLPGLFALLQSTLTMIPAFNKLEKQNPMVAILISNLQANATNIQAHITAVIAAAKQNAEFTAAEEAKWQADFEALRKSPAWQITP